MNTDQQYNLLTIDEKSKLLERIFPELLKNKLSPLVEKLTEFENLKLVFNNEKKDEIEMTEMVPGFTKVIEFPNLFHNIEVRQEDNSIYIFIIETAPGLACSCCGGSGRKKGT